MRGLVLVLIVAMLSGCAGSQESDGDEAPIQEGCDGALRSHTLYLGPGLTLQNDTPEAGSSFSNGFDEAFLVDDMDEWHSEPVDQPIRLLGNMTLEFWVRNDGTPAPYVASGEPTEGYHWFNQFGTERGFIPDYGREDADAVPMPGDVHHHTQTFAMPPGGLHVETGDRLRLLLTSLVVDDDQGTGQHILFGGDTPSAIKFDAHCMIELEWDELHRETTTVVMHGNQGLITGQVPGTDGVNQASVPFTLDETTQRLTISLRQTQDTSPLKDDMDLTILDSDGQQVTGIGSPYADETGTFWAANLAASMPPGQYTVRVDSYSGHAYRGEVTVLQETARLA